jgi:hypothetical protein
MKGITELETLASTAMALAVICAFFLGFAGFRILTGRANRTRGALMIAAAAVLIANVLIWTV